MKKMFIIFTVLVLLGVSAFAEEVYNFKFEIKGYGIGEHAIKGKIDDQLREEVSKLKKMRADFLQGNPGYEVRFVFKIEGHTDDETGTNAVNDDYGEKRAAQVENHLRGEFGNSADYSHTSRGSTKKERMVIIHYNLATRAVVTAVAAPIVPSNTNKMSYQALAVIVFGVLVIVVFGFWFFSKTPRKRQDRPQPIAKPVGNGNPDYKKTLGPVSGWRLVDVNGGTENYRVFLEYNDGKFLLPLRKPNGNKIFENSEQTALSRMGNHIAKGRYPDQMQNLLKDRKELVRIN